MRTFPSRFRRHLFRAAMIGVLAASSLHAQETATNSQAAFIPGDPVSGLALVQSSKCLDCHRIGDTGSRLGPDLSDIGSRRSPAVLQRAMVAPDDEVLRRAVSEGRDFSSVRMIALGGENVPAGFKRKVVDTMQLVGARAEQCQERLSRFY